MRSLCDRDHPVQRITPESEYGERAQEHLESKVPQSSGQNFGHISEVVEPLDLTREGPHVTQCCFDFECDKELSLGFARVSHRILPVRVLAQGLS